MRRLLIPLVLALVASAQPATAAPAPKAPFVFSRPALATTVAPRAAELADLDRDGRADLISAVGNTCCPTSVGISVMRGRADGFFEPATVATTESTLPDDLEVEDVDGNGTLDVIAAARVDNAEPGPYQAEVLFGNGDGTLSSGFPLSLPEFTSFAVGRFLADGTLSVVLSGDGGLTMWNQSQGTFVEGASLSASPAPKLLTTDLDRDGQQELLAYGNGTVTLYRGAAAAASVALPDVAGIRAGDVTGDADLEVITTQTNGAVRAFGATLSQVKAYLNAPGGSRQSAVGELDGDQLADVVRLNNTAGMTVFFGKGGSPLQVPLTRPAFEVFLRDATGDGATDILALETDGSIVEVVEGDGTGAFPGVRPVRATMAQHWMIERADFNNDGKLDLVSTTQYPFFDGLAAAFKARVALGDGNSGLTQTTVLDVDGAISGLGVADVNGDGKQDVIVSEYYAASSYFLGNGDGTFLPRVPFATCYFNDGMVTGDFNKDGYGDVASVCNSLIFRNTLSVALGSPGGLVRSPEIPIAVNANQTYTLRTGDVNGDGNADLALAGLDYFESPASCQPDVNCLLQRSDGPVTYLLGLGNGVFEPVTKGAPVAATLYDLALADLNGDGKDDLITSMVYEDRVVIQPGKADGTVGAPITIPTYDYPTVLEAADVTGDGLRDLVITHGPGVLSVHPGTGGFGFGPPTAYSSRAPFGELVLGNYAGDARPDVLASTGSGVEVFTTGT